MKLTDLKIDPNNARYIEREKEKLLIYKLLAYPALLEKNKIGYSEKTKKMIVGNQRLKQLRKIAQYTLSKLKREIKAAVKHFNKVGSIDEEANFEYLKVLVEKKELSEKWIQSDKGLTKDEIEAWSLIDNIHEGGWDNNILEEVWGVDEVMWGIKEEQKEKVKNLEDGESIEIERSVQLSPPMEYILIMAEPNSEMWEDLKMFLQLKKVRRGGYKKGSLFDVESLERVFNWDDFKVRFKKGIDVSSNTK
jgi:predicted transcriptional regulator